MTGARLTRRAATAAALLAFAATTGNAQQGFTLEQVLSAPYPTELVVAPTGGAIGWAFYASGARNVWVATRPDYAARRLTSWTLDDGQELTELAFTPDASAIVFVRGGEDNARGETPNPALNVDGVSQEIWIAPLSGTARKLTTGASITVSPAGKRLAFVRGGEIWSMGLDDTTATQLLHTRGRADNLRWSPDGSRLAFVSRRGDHNFIGVYDVGSKALRYLQPSVDWDDGPVWSPDGKRLAYLKLPTSSRQMEFKPRRSGEPWSIWVGDAATGDAKELWRADSGSGSVFRELDAKDQLRWTAADQVVFPWEKDGWTHLWAVKSSGGPATLLTSGEFEVEHVAMSADRGTIVFSSNQNDVDRRHIWRVACTGGGCGRPSSVTSGTGLEWSPVALPDGKAVALLRSDARMPARPAIVEGSGAPRDLAAKEIPSSFPSAALVVPQQVIFTAADGLQLHGQLFVPSDYKQGQRRPAVVFFHGGSQRQMLLGWHYMFYYSNAYAMNQYLASTGFIVLSVNYRSGIGYGMPFREAINYGATGASEYNDVQGAGMYLRSRSDVDPARIGVWGGSYGGYLTALALARASDMFAAGVDLHGVHDWNLEWEIFAPGANILKDPEMRRLAFQSSPLAFVDTWRSPVLLIQGDDDRNVTFSQTTQLAEELRKRNVHVEQLIFPDEIHDFLLHRDWLAAYSAGSDFFARMLAPRSAAR